MEGNTLPVRIVVTMFFMPWEDFKSIPIEKKEAM